jgi:hypothetical protein
VLLVSGVAIGCRRGQMPSTADWTAPAVTAEGRLAPFQGSDSADSSTALAYGRFVLPVTIRGRTLQVIADHGSSGTLLTDSATDRLRLPHWPAGAARIDTVVRRAGTTTRPDSAEEVAVTRGDTIFRYWGVPDPQPLDSLRIGASRQDSVLLGWELPSASLAPFDGLIGREFLSTFDLLFDMPGGTLRLYERSSRASNGRPPGWIPDGLMRRDCIEASVRRHVMDTTGFGEDGNRELRINPAKRMWEQEEIQLPIRVNGRPIRGMFDSGAGATSINWAEARALGITRESPAVHAYMAGGLRLLTPARKSPDSTPPGYRDSTFQVSGLVLEIGRQRLPSDTIFISDSDFADFPSYATEPIISIGLRELRDYKLFLSYSTGFVCLSRGWPGWIR